MDMAYDHTLLIVFSPTSHCLYISVDFTEVQLTCSYFILFLDLFAHKCLFKHSFRIVSSVDIWLTNL